MAEFNPDDRDSWYYGPLSREDAVALLSPENDGMFLVRDSTTIGGGYVLCVKEEGKVSNYIIKKILVGGMTRYQIGDQDFSDMSNLLNFYRTHYLDTATLVRPVPREKFKAVYDFGGRDPEDLPFKKDEILTIIRHDEEQWWTARNAAGNTGLVPVNYLEKCDLANQSRGSVTTKPKIVQPPTPEVTNLPSSNLTTERQLPAKARVIKDRQPNIYDPKALRLKVGDIITVLAMPITGTWEGELDGKKGVFPFNHIEFID